MDGRQVLTVVEGVVVLGKQVGRTLGVPTANIPYIPGQLALADGIYVADLILMDQGGRRVDGVLNQGYHPTVPGGLPAVEIHLFDFDEDIYGQRVRIRYLHFIRPELTFSSKEEMRIAMLEDIRIAKAWFAAHP